MLERKMLWEAREKASLRRKLHLKTKVPGSNRRVSLRKVGWTQHKDIWIRQRMFLLFSSTGNHFSVLLLLPVKPWQQEVLEGAYKAGRGRRDLSLPFLGTSCLLPAPVTHSRYISACGVTSTSSPQQQLHPVCRVLALAANPWSLVIAPSDMSALAKQNTLFGSTFFWAQTQEH